jgi:hypothetical protein
MTWEFFEEYYKISARTFFERCDFEARTICVDHIIAIKRDYNGR